MENERYRPTQEEKNDIRQAREIIHDGGVILYPSDTMWGLGCDPNNEVAVARITALKKRADKNGYIVLVDQERKLQQYVSTIPEPAYDIIDYAKKPTTIVFEEGQNVAPEVLAEDNSLAVRFCSEGFCQALLYGMKTGLLSTSANISGESFDGNLASIPESIRSSVDYTIQTQNDFQPGAASSIIKINNNQTVEIIRK